MMTYPLTTDRQSALDFTPHGSCRSATFIAGMESATSSLGYDRTTSSVPSGCWRTKKLRRVRRSRADCGRSGASGYRCADLNRDGLAGIVANTVDDAQLVVTPQPAGRWVAATRKYPFVLRSEITLLPGNQASAPDLVARIAEGLLQGPSCSRTRALEHSRAARRCRKCFREHRGRRLQWRPAFRRWRCSSVPVVPMTHRPSSGLPTVRAMELFLPPQSLMAGNLIPSAMAVRGPTRSPRARGCGSDCAGDALLDGDASR